MTDSACDCHFGIAHCTTTRHVSATADQRRTRFTAHARMPQLHEYVERTLCLGLGRIRQLRRFGLLALGPRARETIRPCRRDAGG